MTCQEQKARQQRKSGSLAPNRIQPTFELPGAQITQGTIQRARLDPTRLTPADVMALQRTIGNQTVVEPTFRTPESCLRQLSIMFT